MNKETIKEKLLNIAEKEVKSKIKEMKKQNEFLMKKDNVLQSLKQWLKDNIEHIECTDWSEDYLSGLSEVLSKIEELEGE